VLATCWSACQGTDADLLRGALLLLREQLAPVRQSLEDEALRPTSLAASVLGGNEEARGWLTDTLARRKGGWRGLVVALVLVLLLLLVVVMVMVMVVVHHDDVRVLLGLLLCLDVCCMGFDCSLVAC
jgi:hypothetical protein